jgi:membrane-bound serine protease (ClpP class)
VLALSVVCIGAAIILALAEAHVSTGGLIAGAGVVALVCGVVLLSAAAGLGALAAAAIGVVVSAVALTGLYVLGRSLLSVRTLRPRSGPEAMVGHVGVIRVGATAPRVFVDGSLWRAIPSVLDEGADLHDGDPVVVERVSGLTLRVRRAEEWELNP